MLRGTRLIRTAVAIALGALLGRASAPTEQTSPIVETLVPDIDTTCGERLASAELRLADVRALLGSCRATRQTPQPEQQSVAVRAPVAVDDLVNEGDVQVATLEAQHAGETDDPAWSRPTEAFLSAVARGLTGPVSSASVECGKDTCLVQVDGAPDDPAVTGPLARLVTATNERLSQSAITELTPGQTTVVFARPGVDIVASGGGGSPQ